MAIFDVDVEGVTYEVDAPDENTAWQWANITHKQTPKTTAEGVVGAVTRGIAPIAAGAALGAAAGAPIAGVGAIPGAIAGAGAAGLAQFVGDPIVSSINSMLGTKYTMPTQAMEDFLTRIGVAEPKTEAERIIQATASGAAGAGGIASAGRAIQSAASSPVAKAVGGQLAAQPAMQVTGGAGAGAAGSLAEEKGAGPVGQIAASLAGGVAGAKLAGTKIRPSAAVPQELKEAEQAGVRVMTSDVMPPGSFASRWLRSTGEKIPLAGTGGERQAQQTQRVDAVRNLLRDFGADDAAKASDSVMADLAGKRAADLTKYTSAKSEVINRLSSAGSVPVSRTVQAVDDQISSLKALKTQEVEPVIARLEDWKSAIQGQNLTNVEILRKQIGESFKAPELASVRSTGEKSLSKIYAPLIQDMTEFIKTNGQRRDFDKWSVANKRLSSLAGEIKTGTMKSVLSRGDATPEVINQMLFSSKPSEVRQLFGSLTQSGKANARMAILARAAEKAGGIENISPDRFANEVKRLGSSVGVFFSGDDLKRVQGLTRVLNLTKRAQEASASPPTGVQLAIPVGAAVLTDILGGAGAATVAGATIGLASRAYESAAVRNMLMKIPQVAKGSKEELALAKRIIATIEQQSKESKEK